MKATKSMRIAMTIGIHQIACVMLICLASAAMPTYAQARNSAPSRMRLDVPFAFTVGNRTFPAGDYTFETLLNDAQGIEILVVRCNDRPIYHAVASNTLRGNDQQLGSKLVFNRYGNRYFLAQIWGAGRLTGLRLQTSTQEIDLQTNQVGHEVELAVPEQPTVASAAGPRK